MDDFLVGNTVDHRHRFLINALSGSLVASDNRLLHTLYGRAQGGAQACVVGALLDGLAGTLTGLCAVGPELIPKKANVLIENA